MKPIRNVNGAPYPWARAVKRFKAFGRRSGITKAAKQLRAYGVDASKL